MKRSLPGTREPLADPADGFRRGGGGQLGAGAQPRVPTRKAENSTDSTHFLGMDPNSLSKNNNKKLWELWGGATDMIAPFLGFRGAWPGYPLPGSSSGVNYFEVGGGGGKRLPGSKVTPTQN